MGRYDLRPLHVYKTTTMQLLTKQISRLPPWYASVSAIPPSSALVRPQPIQHHKPTRRSRRRRNARPSRMFQPQELHYEEDQLRAQFFGDHPWELARPRVVLEDDGKDSQRTHWGRGLVQEDRTTDGESVVQRMQYLMNPTRESKEGEPRLTAKQAYDAARKELYTVRHAQEVERRVAKEEALSTGAWFGPSAVDIGMQLEDKTWDQLRSWAERAAIALQQSRSGAYTGVRNQGNELLGDGGTEMDVDNAGIADAGSSEDEVNSDSN